MVKVKLEVSHWDDEAVDADYTMYLTLSVRDGL